MDYRTNIEARSIFNDIDGLCASVREREFIHVFFHGTRVSSWNILHSPGISPTPKEDEVYKNFVIFVSMLFMTYQMFNHTNDAPRASSGIEFEPQLRNMGKFHM